MRDRFDLRLHVAAVPWAEIREPAASESSATVRARVVAARARQTARQGVVNARLDGPALRDACRLGDAAAESLLAAGATRFHLSARGVARVLRVARTIADLDGAEAIAAPHLAEALQFRGGA
jgi:magnesium chelatase family protein